LFKSIRKVIFDHFSKNIEKIRKIKKFITDFLHRNHKVSTKQK